MTSIGWISLHAHRPPNKGGTNWRRQITSPASLQSYLYQQFQRPHTKFYIHQPAPWFPSWAGGSAMAAGQFYCIGKDHETKQPEYRDAILETIEAAMIQRPHIRIGIYGGLHYQSPATTFHGGNLWHPDHQHSLWGMFTMNVLKWHEAGIRDWWLDAGAQPGERENSLLFRQHAEAYGVTAGLEAFPVDGWDDNDDTSTYINPSFSKLFPAVADVQYVYNGLKQSEGGVPWEIPMDSQPHYVMLHRKVKLWDHDGRPEVWPDDPRVRPMLEQCADRGYLFGCDDRYDDVVTQLTAG